MEKTKHRFQGLVGPHDFQEALLYKLHADIIEAHAWPLHLLCNPGEQLPAEYLWSYHL